MDFALIWLSFIIASVLATFVAFSLVVPSRIRKKPVDEREAAYKRARSWLVKAQLLWGAVVGMTGLAIGNHGLVLTGLIAFGWAPIVHRSSEISKPGRVVKEDIASKYKDSVLGVLALFAGVALMSVFTMQTMARIERHEAEDAAYNQTVTYHLDADGRKLEGDTLTYPVSNLGTNVSGNTYRWVERHEDGVLVTQIVKKTSTDKSSGVIVKDDLPATDTEARVERITEYKVKGDDIAAGKEVCAEKYDLEYLFDKLPKCGKGMTRARFVKTRIVIHVPAGSADKMLPVVPD